MPILRTAVCGKCGVKEMEKIAGEGWNNWGMLKGKQNEKGETEFMLCPEHLNKTIKFIIEDLK